MSIKNKQYDFNDGDIIKLSTGEYGEIAHNGVKRLYIKVCVIYTSGNYWKFNDTLRKVYLKDVLEHYSLQQYNYKNAWKRAGFRVLNENTLVRNTNETDLGEFDTSDESEDESETSSMKDFIISDSDDDEYILCSVNSCDNNNSNTTPGQNRYINKIHELECKYS